MQGCESAVADDDFEHEPRTSSLSQKRPQCASKAPEASSVQLGTQEIHAGSAVSWRIHFIWSKRVGGTRRKHILDKPALQRNEPQVVNVDIRKIVVPVSHQSAAQRPVVAERGPRSDLSWRMFVS